MKKLLSAYLLFSLLAMSSCSGLVDFGNAKLPVTDIAKRSAEIIQALELADMNKDGEIRGNLEWTALGTQALSLFMQWSKKAEAR